MRNLKALLAIVSVFGPAIAACYFLFVVNSLAIGCLFLSAALLMVFATGYGKRICKNK